MLLDNLFELINLFRLHANAYFDRAMHLMQNTCPLEVCLCLSSDFSKYLVPCFRDNGILSVTVELL